MMRELILMDFGQKQPLTARPQRSKGVTGWEKVAGTAVTVGSRVFGARLGCPQFFRNRLFVFFVRVAFPAKLAR